MGEAVLKTRSLLREARRPPIFFFLAAVLCAGGGLWGACSSKASPCATCVTASCPTGNVCVDGQCSLLCTRHSDCPEELGFRCATGVADDGSGQAQVCRPGAVPRALGGYGASCGLHLDADCDATQGFICPGRQNDVDAFCTKLDGCTDDSGCPSTMYCGSMARRGCVRLTYDCATQSDCDSFPSFTCSPDGTGRKFCTHEESCHTQPDDCALGFACQSLAGAAARYDLARACVPRRACAPCHADLDCADPGSACLPDQNGEGFCTRTCEPGGTSCDPGASCVATARGNYCVPRSGSCHGDGTSPCSACRDNGDCGPQGRCQLIEETRERFCIEPCLAGGACPNAPGGGTMTCCSNPATCGSVINTCLPDPADNPYPRFSSGCWLAPCHTNADCAAGQLCDIRLRSQPPGSTTEQVTQCGTAGVCRLPHDPSDAIDFQVFHHVCDCGGTEYASEAELALVPDAAFKGCCMSFTSGGITYSCPTAPPPP
jgi:hypothetical protein